ncbi:hypothetical protein ACXYTJ_09870 [Gilvimarinus sp. F26214L]|uniref:hypothetical protein n=1 Tax=Gilvimarinus sp. DZF01 TaxID=3461371 RepID=UPI0040466BC9
MSNKVSLVTKFGLTALTVAVVGCATQTQTTQTQERPDLNGIWTNISMTGLTRPAGIDKLELTAEEAERVAQGLPVAGISASERRDAASGTDPNAGAPEKGAKDFGVRGYDSFWIDPGESLAKVQDGYRTSYIVDPENGQIPWREGKQPSRANAIRYVTGEGANSDPEALPLTERCIISFGNTAGPGMLSVLYNNNYQFIQTDDHVMILTEMIHDARIVPIYDNAEEARTNHRPDEMKLWYGDSVGWYEDGALYVETTNIRPEQMAQASVSISENGRITERFERWDENQIFYRFIVEDDSLYTQPWTAELAFYPSDGPIYEYACHEGNYSIENILRGARMKEADQAKQGR